ncbi:MAG: YidB family protein [Terriglobia bacterium]
MGLFDDLIKGGLSSMAGGSQQEPAQGLAGGIMEMLTNQQSGGLQGLLQNFTQKGLGDIVSSWVSTGKNLPVSGDQIQSALGSDTISALAQKAGIAPDMANSLLAQVLPMIVDKLTPDGKIPETSNLLEQGLNALKAFKS